MSSGLPDFYRGIDVAFQSLGQIINRPKYGGADVVDGTVIVTATSGTTLVTVTGKGMIYGGYMYLDSAASQKTGSPLLNVDGNLLTVLDFEEMNKFGLSRQWSKPYSLVKYNEVDFVYAVQLYYGITFETSFFLSYSESEGATPSVRYAVVYALI